MPRFQIPFVAVYCAPMSLQIQCAQCRSPFIFTDEDAALLTKLAPTIAGQAFELMPPTYCPDCRLRRRLAWRVERSLYFRTCDLSGQKMLSIIAPNSPYKAYHHEAWYSDKWDAQAAGRPFDFSQPFFSQFAALMREVPLLGLNLINNQNCEFVNQVGYSKNCYLIIEADYNENCLFSYRIFYSRSSVDCTEVTEVERCYECVDCTGCYGLLYSERCKQCSESAFLSDCHGCQSCFGCTGLRQKQHCLFNQQLSKEEYRAQTQGFDFCNPEHVNAAKAHAASLCLMHPRKALIGEQNENVTGDYIDQSKDCANSFGLKKCRDCRHCSLIRDSKDCMDYFVFGAKAERIYDSECCGSSVANLIGCCDCWESHDLFHCLQCVNGSSDCFGCVGMRHQKYSILNKQYTREQYEELVPKIIEHMRRTKEWGEFFPASLSPYSYNETVAQEYFPMDKDAALAEGLSWQDNLPFTIGKETIGWDQVPQAIDQVPDTITQEVLACQETGKNFRITVQELAYYRDLRLPIPRLHPDERHKRRMALRNPRKLWDRTCAKCQKPITTSYPPSRPETIYCESCYLATVY